MRYRCKNPAPNNRLLALTGKGHESNLNFKNSLVTAENKNHFPLGKTNLPGGFDLTGGENNVLIPTH